jgi:glutathione S-transferase
MATEKFQLFSFSTCPYLQSIIINLKEKQQPFDVSYVDLYDKPSFLDDLVPLGRLPVLKIGKDLLFESSAINEYLEDISTGRLRPEDPIQCAHTRAWIIFIHDSLMSLYKMLVAKQEDEYADYLDVLSTQLIILDQSATTPYFMGEDMSLVDVEIAPLLYRIQLIKNIKGPNLLANTDNLQKVSNNLLNKKSVKESVPDIFDKAFVEKIKGFNGHLAQIIHP